MGSVNSIPPVVFSGQSKFAADFQQVLTRAVAIASLPMQNLQNELSTLTSQQSSLTSLQGTFNSLQSALENISSSSTSVTANSSDPSSVTASASSSALSGTYTVQVTTLGSPTTVLSNAGSPAVTDPTTGNLSTASSFTLTVNGNTTTLTPSGNSLDDLASAINSSSAGVQATVVNVGANSSPDYRLALTTDNLGSPSDTLTLSDGTNNNLLGTPVTGQPTSFTVDGVPTSTTSQQITLAPGVTADLLQTSTSPVTISVAQDSSSLGSALSSFATAYNSAVDAVAAQHGQNAGALAGDSTILELNQALSSLSDFTGGGAGLTSLADLGLTLDTNGHLNFDATVLNSADPSTVQQFLGGLTSGGFLEAANNTLTSLTDPTSGLIQDSLTTLQSAISGENSQIAEQQDQINTVQTNMQQQLAQADASLSVLESQETYMTNLFAAMYPNSTNSSSTSGIAG